MNPRSAGTQESWDLNGNSGSNTLDGQCNHPDGHKGQGKKRHIEQTEELGGSQNKIMKTNQSSKEKDIHGLK